MLRSLEIAMCFVSEIENNLRTRQFHLASWLNGTQFKKLQVLK